MLRDDTIFGYQVWPYRIPSQDPEKALNLQVATFIDNFGHEDNLIVVYYGGHGGGGPKPKTKTKGPCTWAASVLVDHPAQLDWSLIQPQLSIAESDVLILLDCCYAGEAARARPSGNMDLLAATDKDQETPRGGKKWPSFTKVLMRELKKFVEKDGVVDIPTLHKSMSQFESGTKRQPFYVCMGGNAGSIKLRRHEDTPTAMSAVDPPISTRSLQIQLSLFNDLDPTTVTNLVRWMTRDSPSTIENIRVVSRVLSNANEANRIGESMLGRVSEDGTALLPYLSEAGQKEAQRLLSNLRKSMSNEDQYVFDTSNILAVIEEVKKASSQLVTFVAESLTRCDPDTLKILRSDLSYAKDLKSRISMRLTMIEEEESPDKLLKVSFSDTPHQGQRMRPGEINKSPVLVEYIYDNADKKSYARTLKQIKRINTLQSEPKAKAFRCLKGLGYLHETLYGPRFGFVYELPQELVDKKFCTLADLMAKVRFMPLNDRWQLAGTLCNAMLHIHSIGWYHKNIKASNVLVFAKSSGANSEKDDSISNSFWNLEQVYMIGFDCSRPQDAETRKSADFRNGINIYRHPERWGTPQGFKNYHDLYALGIMLMEIGCWRTLAKMTEPGFLENLKRPEILREMLLGEMMVALVHSAGTTYANAIKACLEKNDWSTLEDWQAQGKIRESVLEPLMTCLK